MSKKFLHSHTYIRHTDPVFLLMQQDNKNLMEPAETEVIPEDIVEMRDDQIRLASIDLDTIEMRYDSTRLKSTET